MRRRQKLLLLCTVVVGTLCVCFRPGHSDEDGTKAAKATDQETDCKKKVSIFIPDNPKYAAYILKIQTNKDLVCLERSEPVYVALLGRNGVDIKYRREAINELARIRNTEPLQQLLASVLQIDKGGVTTDPADEGGDEASEAQLAEVLATLTEMLGDFPAQQLAAQRATLEEIATTSQHAAVRTFGYVGLIDAGGGIDEVWETATAHGIDDLLSGVRFLRSDDVRAGLYEKLAPLLRDAPDADVRRAAIRAAAYVPGHDAEVFTSLSELINNEEMRDDAIVALRQMGGPRWSKDRLNALAGRLVEYVSAVPADQRTASNVQAAVTLTEDLAALLPDGEGAEVVASLAALSVQVIRVKTLHEEMTYDQSVLVVQAGRPVEIQLDNGDNTPHNLVITVPGAYEEIGLTADLMATQPGAAKLKFIPPSDKILYHTRMLEPGQTEPLFFVAPDKPDVYPFLCTFPGHWLKMYGVLVVVEDEKAYLAENDPLPSADQLLGIVTCTHDYDALVEDMSALQSGRSFVSGQRQFARASCQSCHSMQGKGGRIGPELAEVSKKYKPHEILRHMMYPSEVIDPKFAKVEIIDEDGKPHLGVIVKETETEIHLMADPLADCEPEVIAKSEDIERFPSKVSPMPEGLLDRVCGDALWDLLAYVIAGGDPANPAFAEQEK